MIHSLVIYKCYWSAGKSYISHLFSQSQKFCGPADDLPKVARWLAMEALNTSSLNVFDYSLKYLGFVLQVVPLVNGQPIDELHVRAVSPYYFSLPNLRKDLAKLTYSNQVEFLAQCIDNEVLAVEGKLLTKEGLTLNQHFAKKNRRINDFYIVAVFLVFSGDNPESSGEETDKSTLKKPLKKNNPYGKYYSYGASLVILSLLGVIVLYLNYLTIITN